jgi:hypothetical protein
MIFVTGAATGTGAFTGTATFIGTGVGAGTGSTVGPAGSRYVNQTARMAARCPAVNTLMHESGTYVM